MRFEINYDDKKVNRELSYDETYDNIDVKPIPRYAYLMQLNYLEINVLENGRVICAGGLSDLSKAKRTSLTIPDYREGSLTVVSKLDPDFGTYQINRSPWPIWINPNTGWACIGDPAIQGQAVEFVSNCVAVLDHVGNLKALWLKPDQLPIPDDT